jgi:hypothetical protein
MRIGSPVELCKGGLRRDGKEIVGSWQMINRGFFNLFVLLRLNTTTIKNSFTLHRAIMTLLVLRYYITLHISAPEAIMRWYNLTNILKLLNGALYMVSYNLNTYY